MLENKLFEDTGRRPPEQGDRTVVRALVIHANNLCSALCRPSGLPSTPHECILNMSTGWDGSQIKRNRKMPPLCKDRSLLVHGTWSLRILRKSMPSAYCIFSPGPRK